MYAFGIEGLAPGDLDPTSGFLEKGKGRGARGRRSVSGLSSVFMAESLWMRWRRRALSTIATIIEMASKKDTGAPRSAFSASHLVTRILRLARSLSSSLKLSVPLWALASTMTMTSSSAATMSMDPKPPRTLARNPRGSKDRDIF